MMRRKSASSPDSPRRQKHGGDSEDRISDLPDPIIDLILSLLPTKNAVATAILSKRWKLLWTSVGNLDISFDGGAAAKVEQFVKSISYAMLHHKPAGYFNRFSLTWNTECIPFYVDTWICTAVARDVRQLFVDVGFKYQFPLHVQSCLFSSENLISLDLQCKPISISPEIVVSLPRLEKLNLAASFESEDAFCKLLAGCPVLKHLVIRIRNFKAAFKCLISSASLKYLRLYDYDVPCSVELAAPSLEHIELEGCIYCIVVKQRLNLLCDARIELYTQQTRALNYCNSYVEALDALSCAKTLDLPLEVIRALSCATIKMLSSFNRLTKLNVCIAPNHWCSIQNFIELSDNLEDLTIYKEECRYLDEGPVDNPNWMKPSVVPKCLSKSLTMVSFSGYDGHHDELALVEYIIKHGRVLLSMRIYFGVVTYIQRRSKPN